MVEVDLIIIHTSSKILTTGRAIAKLAKEAKVMIQEKQNFMLDNYKAGMRHMFLSSNTTNTHSTLLNNNTNSSKHHNEATITFDTPERGDSVDPSDMRHGKQASA